MFKQNLSVLVEYIDLYDGVDFAFSPMYGRCLAHCSRLKRTFHVLVFGASPLPRCYSRDVYKSTKHAVINGIQLLRNMLILLYYYRRQDVDINATFQGRLRHLAHRFLVCGNCDKVESAEYILRWLRPIRRLW